MPLLTDLNCCGAIYQHAADYSLAPHLQRFLAVVSNLYRSFLDRKKRAAADFPLRQSLPPLASFKFVGDHGPFTIPVDSIEQLIDGSVGVVSLPATYADHPVLWPSLAHETGGHDVVHADQGLLEELQGGLKQALRRVSVPGLTADELVALWAYWMDEAVADVYGLLNIGPTFGPNLAGFFAALRSKPDAGGFPIPKISMRSVSPPDRPLDVHPTDILRIHLALGVVETSNGLAAPKRNEYVADLKQLAALCASGDTVEISGFAVLNAADAVRFDAAVPLSRLQESARQVGRYIATVKLATLGNHSVQDIETWTTRMRRALKPSEPLWRRANRSVHSVTTLSCWLALLRTCSTRRMTTQRSRRPWPPVSIKALPPTPSGATRQQSQYSWSSRPQLRELASPLERSPEGGGKFPSAPSCLSLARLDLDRVDIFIRGRGGRCNQRPGGIS